MIIKVAFRPCSDNAYAAIYDPYKVKFNWRNSGGTTILADWASSLLPYLGLPPNRRG